MFRELLKDIGGTILLLFAGIVFFACLLVFVEWRFQQDAQVFQVISGLLTGFGGAMLGLITKDKLKPPANP